jgi:hypothetical protein
VTRRSLVDRRRAIRHVLCDVGGDAELTTGLDEVAAVVPAAAPSVVRGTGRRMPPVIEAGLATRSRVSDRPWTLDCTKLDGYHRALDLLDLVDQVREVMPPGRAHLETARPPRPWVTAQIGHGHGPAKLRTWFAVSSRGPGVPGVLAAHVLKARRRRRPPGRDCIDPATTCCV